MNPFADAVLDGIRRLEAGRSLLLDDNDLEGIHDMRTAARRLRTAYRCLGARSLRETAGPALREFMAALGPARDLDVLLHAIGTSTTLDVTDRESLRASVERSLEEALPAVRACVEGEAFARLVQTARAAAALPAPEASASPILRAVERVLASAPEDWETAPDGRLHDVRKDVKRLRYALEAFQPAYGKPVARTIERCRALQEALGTVQDVATFGELLRDRTFAAGQFLAMARSRATAARRELPSLWRRALGPRALARLGAHLLRRSARKSEPVELRVAI